MHDEVVAEVAAGAERIRLGNGLDPASRVRAAGVRGAPGQGRGLRRLRAGRGRPRWSRAARRPDDPALADGFFYRPTVFADVTREMRVIREETFGPMLTVERFSTEAEAIELGNDTHYGLAGAVWTSDAGPGAAGGGRAAARHGVDQRLPPVRARRPSGAGSSRSGNGRELGPTGLAEYQELKHVWHNTEPAPAGWFSG